MNIHILQHVSYEGIAGIESWIKKKNHTISETKFFNNYKLPELSKIDVLIVMGGPMGVYDEYKFPWLIEEKKYLERALENNKTIIGICLGSQLLADVLGAKVYKNKHKEIGWFDISFTNEIKKNGCFKDADETMTVFHWHGDTFDLPKDSTKVASSSITKNQGFLFNDNVIGLQFHIESNCQSIQKLINNSKNELANKDFYIQKEDEIIKNCKKYTNKMNKVLFNMLDKIIKN